MSAQPEQSYFDQFWERWPKPSDPGYSDYTRRADKRKCKELWDKRKYDKIAIDILHDVTQRAQYDKGWRSSNGGFLCAPLVYLRNERWADGSFADLRDSKRPQQKPKANGFNGNDGPQLSRWARGANKVLLRLAYQDIRRGFKPIGKEALAQLLVAKNDYVRIAENAEKAGERWPDADFIDMCKEGFEKVLL